MARSPSYGPALRSLFSTRARRASGPRTTRPKRLVSPGRNMGLKALFASPVVRKRRSNAGRSRVPRMGLRAFTAGVIRMSPGGTAHGRRVARTRRSPVMTTVEGVTNYKGRQVYESLHHKQFVLGQSKKTGQPYRIYRVRLTTPVRKAGGGVRHKVIHEVVGVNSKGRNIMVSKGGKGKRFVMAVSKTGKHYRVYKFKSA